MGKAQIAIEYLMIIGIAFAILIPLFYFAGERSSVSIRTSQVENAINTLVNAADTVYSLGPGSKKAVTITIPDGINNSEILGKNLVYDLKVSSGIDQIHSSSNAFIVGALPEQAGTYKVFVEMLEGGLVRIGLNSTTPGTGNCLTFDLLSASIDDDELEGVRMLNGCSQSLTLTKIRVIWDNSKKIREVKFQDAAPSWTNNCNWECTPPGVQSSGELLDFGDRDYVLIPGGIKEITKVEFNGNMPTTEFSITIVLDDASSSSTGSFTITSS